MRKILFVITKSEIGGAQTWVRDQCRLLVGHAEIHIITDECGWLGMQQLATSNHYHRGIRSLFSLPFFIFLINLIRIQQYDVIISSSANAGLYCRLARIFYTFRCIYVSHGWSCLYKNKWLRPIFVFMEYVLAHMSDLIICVSQADYDKAIEKIRIAPARLQLIRNAVFAMPPRGMKLPTEPLQLLFVGRLASPKRIDLLMAAIRNDPRFHLTVVGAGPLRTHFHEMANVRFLGAIASFDRFCDYDAFILASESEGLPMSAIEAASAGLPVLLSNVGGCFECVTDQKLLFNNNELSILASLDYLYLNYNFLLSIAIERREEWDLIKMKCNYLDAYQG
ncbi:glycosyltransferase [Chitinibacter sp. S2-10]|uniref:glycosyltransferase n=1 Tax=Chitinibacter sp. S2-10 TaxID=3373597 RepID=UPI003977C539